MSLSNSIKSRIFLAKPSRASKQPRLDFQNLLTKLSSKFKLSFATSSANALKLFSFDPALSFPVTSILIVNSFGADTKHFAMCKKRPLKKLHRNFSLCTERLKNASIENKSFESTDYAINPFRFDSKTRFINPTSKNKGGLGICFNPHFETYLGSALAAFTYLTHKPWLDLYQTKVSLLERIGEKFLKRGLTKLSEDSFLAFMLLKWTILQSSPSERLGVLQF